MRDQLHLMELVDNYLDGTMNATDRAAFEERLRANDELRSLMEDQRNLRTAARRSPVRAAARRAYRKYNSGKVAKGGMFGGIVLIAITAAFFLWKANSGTHGSPGSEEPGGNYAVLSDTTGTHLSPFILTVDPAKDTTVITPSGIVLDVPRGAFVDDNGQAITTPVHVTLVEALDPLDIMKAGLSTMSGSTLLETGGMFYIDAQANGTRAKIDPAKPLTAMIPAQANSDSMMLYQGVKGTNGLIDWRDPKPLKKSLVPVDITTLNFYPPGYEAKLLELGQDVMNKAFKDSLYYSFASQTLSGDSTIWKWEGDRYLQRADTLFSPWALGQSLFHFGKNRCSSCHSTTKEMTGPPMKGAKARWKGKSSIYDFVRNPQKVIASGDPYANTLFKRYNSSVMPPVDLSDADIDAIFYWADQTQIHTNGINPAKVKSIWNERFNNTNLATKEFEARMHAIHGTCDNAVLDAYVNNLDKDLSEIDKQVAMAHSEFNRFALRNDGRVDLPAHAADRLRTFYERHSRMEAEAIRKTQEAFWNAQAKLDAKGVDKRNEHDLASSVRAGELFEKELNANMDTVYKQLGLKHRWLPRAAWVVPVTNAGWWNVDMAVIQATTTRSSMSYTDDKTGKTATLTYTPFNVEVTDRSSYSELKVYLIPNQLNSFQRMNEVGGTFTEKLNSIFSYDLVCIGMKDGKQYAFGSNGVNGSATITATLQPADDNGLRQLLRSRGQQVENGLLEEARFMEWSAADRARQDRNQARLDLHKQLVNVVFPCAKFESANADSTRVSWE